MNSDSAGVSLLSKTIPPLKMPGKRIFDDCDYQSPKSAPPFKRRNASLTRNFPRNCGPFAPNRQRGSGDLSGEGKSSNLAMDGIVIVAKPLSIIPPPDAEFEYMKLDVPYDCEVDIVRQKLKAKANQKLDSAVALEMAKSENGATDDALPKETGDLTDFKASSQPLKITSKYPPPKIRKGVTSFRNFPLNCGEDHVSLFKVAMDNGKSNSETKPRIVIAESNDKSIEDDDQDSVIIGAQQNSDQNGNVVKDQSDPSHITENTPSKRVQVPHRCDSDWKGEETDDKLVCMISPIEWNQLKSGLKRLNDSTTDIKDESLVEEMGKHSEEYSTENFAEPGTYTNRGNYDEDQKVEKLKDLCCVPYDADKAIVDRNKVQEALKLFEELYSKLFQEYKTESKGGRVTKQMHTEAAILLRNQQKWVNIKPIFGHVPGVEIGDQFQYRVELAMVGLHHQFISGINCVTVKGKKYANSVVDSGRYKNKVLSRDIIVYSGQGGNPKVGTFLEKSADQKLEGGNLAMKHSKEANLPVRVIRKSLLRDKKMYIYEGLYIVTDFWQERTQTDKLAFMFEMVRLPGQPDSNYLEINESRESMGYLESIPVAADDVSQGKETIPIRVVNAMSNEKPQPFTYITKIKYPNWYQISEPRGCDCIDGCSDFKPCHCAYKNGGEIPFNEEGSIIKAKRFVHECGPSCKCPPTCQNRVSQRGPRFQLEVFKTKSTGWGVRSRDEIPSGGFICEYIGEVLHDKEAEQRINDEYLFDLDNNDGFTIDAAQYGNVGRFINHSCSPNLYAQNVLYDNYDRRLPHIMLFATRKIPPLQELSYCYNYKIDRVCDANGNIRMKLCRCGSRKCTGRMY